MQGTERGALTCAGHGGRFADKGGQAGAGEAAQCVATRGIPATNVGALAAFFNIHTERP